MSATEANRTDASAGLERDSKLALDQLMLALRNLGPNHFMMPSFGAIICVMFARWVDPVRLGMWWAVLCFSVMPLALVSSRFAKRSADDSDRYYWLARLGSAYFLSCTVWACAGFVLWSPNNDLNHMLIMLILACSLAAHGALVASSKPLTIVGFVSYGSALVLAPLQQGGFLYDGLSLLALLYVGYLFSMSRNIHDTARNMLLLKNDKSDLLSALATAKVQSDQARDRAEAASLAKSEFLANMSHELRTPLNAILGFSELIASRRFDAERHYEYASLIHGSGAHLLALINDILDLAKIEAGQTRLNEDEIDLGELIGEVMTLMRPKADAGGCVLVSTVVARDMPPVLADARAIKQVLLNLMSNAVKFTPASGRVTAFAWAEADGSIVFGVADTGVGIGAEDQARVFQNFGQGRHDIVVADKGTGLGLPIVKGLIEAHGGTVTLASKPNEGTTATVRLPSSRVLPRRRAAS